MVNAQPVFCAECFSNIKRSAFFFAIIEESKNGKGRPRMQRFFGKKMA